MIWKPLPRIAFAVAIYPFQASSPADLPLEIGDELYIIEQGGVDGAWYRGYLVAPPSLLSGLTSVKGKTLEARVFTGIFPRCCVEVRELLAEGRVRRRSGGHGERIANSYGQGGQGEHRSNGIITPPDSIHAGDPLCRADSGLKNRTSKSSTPSGLDSVVPGHSSIRHGWHGGKRAKTQATEQATGTGGMQSLAQLPTSFDHRDPNPPRPKAPVPMLKVGDETITSAEEPLVDEIASCLREWHSLKLHEFLLARRYSGLDKMSTLVQKLDTARRQLLHKVLTAQELHSLRETIVWDLVNGNKMFNGEVIVRSAEQRGRILTADDSAVELTALQSMMSLLDERPVPSVDEHRLHHLAVELKTFSGQAEEPTTINLYLCLKSPGDAPRSLSEMFAIDIRAKDAFSAAGSEDTLRTLFTDLSAADIGEGAGSGSNLFLVLKVLTNAPFRTSTTLPWIPNPPRESTSSQSSPDIYQSNANNVKPGRRSLMWSQKNQKGRKDSEHSIKVPETRPTSGSSNRANAIEPRNIPVTRATSSRDAKTAKRTVAIGVLRVDQLLKDHGEAERDMTVWAPAPGFEETEEQGRWDNLIPELISSPTGQYRQYATINHFRMDLKSFEHADAETLVEKTPTLLHSIFQTRKIGFSGAPTKPRSDIYLTLIEPFLPRNASLSHPKSGSAPLAAQTGMANLQLTLEVRRSTGERIENCIYPSCNSAGHTAWRTPAIERGESWNLTVRLAISSEDVPGSHVVMSIADAPGFPFALCWIPLWSREAFIRDGDHSLALYKYDEYTSSMISGRGAYLALPWSTRKKDEAFFVPSMAALRLRTYLCSTKYSQDPNLLGLLKWREQGVGEVIAVLKKFPFVPEIEIVKLLNEVFDALFEILNEYAGSEEYEDLIFNALVVVLGIVHDRRFRLSPLVDQYAKTHFQYPSAAPCLLRSFNRLLANPLDSDASRKLRAAFKVGGHVFKFIVTARQQQSTQQAGVGISRQSNFARDLQTVFTSMQALMLHSAPVVVGTKTLLVQAFHTWLPELMPLLNAQEVLKVATGFVESCANVQGRLILYKLVLLIHLSHLNVFKTPDLRRRLIHSTIRWIAPHWGVTEAVTEQWRDQVRLCCSVVASQLSELGQEACEYIPKLVDSYRSIRSTPQSSKEQLSLLFPSSYPFPTRSTAGSARFDEALVEISAVLAAITNLPMNIHLDLPRDDLADFLLRTLQVYISILNGEAFPKSWLSVYSFHHKSTIKSLGKLSSILIEHFVPDPDEIDQFNTELWRAFFDALLKVVGSDALALEVFPEQKRRAVWKIAGDVRELGAELLRLSWDAIGWETDAEERKSYGIEKMGGFQVQYVPSLVGPIVELCLSVHDGLRGVAIEVLQSMIVSEWMLSQDLEIVQAEIVECLDCLFKTKRLTESLDQQLFVKELTELFEPLAQIPDEPLYSAVKGLISTIDELLDLLVAVHSTGSTESGFHLMDTLHLMEFLKDLRKEDIYIKYVHDLAQLQGESGNHTEAGLALRLHADLYQWDPTVAVEALVDPLFPAQTEFERKEQLYFRMIKQFEEGLSWDNALDAYSELLDQYEHSIFDFSKLARAQRAMATIYESISKGEIENPRYFRVVYKGLGFPGGLRDKQFIFEGRPNDRVATFTDHLQKLHPAAQILTHAGEEDLEGQYLQVSAVSPQRDLLHPICQRARVPQHIRDYCLLSRPGQFATTSRRQRSDGNAYGATVQKTVYTTAEHFPTILKRSEIVEVATVTLSPLQTAVERTTRKTSELLAIEKRITEGEDGAFNQLTDALMLSVVPASESSVANHRRLLPQREDGDLDEDIEQEPAMGPLQNALRTAMVDHAVAIKRCLGLFSRPAQQATKAHLTERTYHLFLAVLNWSCAHYSTCRLRNYICTRARIPRRGNSGFLYALAHRILAGSRFAVPRSCLCTISAFHG